MKNITITLTPKEAWVLWHLANSNGFTSTGDATKTPLGYKGWGISRYEWRDKTRHLTDAIWDKVDSKIQKDFYPEIESFCSLDEI